MAGCGARTALELSIDLESSVDPEEETNFDKQRKMLFCCISNLDSRSSLMVGLPRILQDQIKQQHLNALVRSQRYPGTNPAKQKINRILLAIFAPCTKWIALPTRSWS